MPLIFIAIFTACILNRVALNEGDPIKEYVNNLASDLE